jgi:tRNA nucleotidyltransferase (CCA-adding enzyme)
MKSPLQIIARIFPAVFHSRILLVGGCVRDALAGKESNDIDLVAALTEDELTGLGFRLVEAKSATAIYFRHHHDFGKIEITRIESMADLPDDLMRRDFTINAMALDSAGVLLDPFGSSRDVSARVLRTCSNKTFSDDPLRLFRAFRFAADGWRMTDETMAQIRQHDWSTALRSVPVERITAEMLKALAAPTPERFFELMREFAIGEDVMPELFRMPTIPAGPPEHHPEGDLFTHSTQVLQRVAAQSHDPSARFCAFFHDIGKLATDPALYPKHHGHDNAGFALAEELCNRLCLPTTYRTALSWVSRLHGKANTWDILRDSTRMKMAEQAIKAGITEILPLVAAADKAGNGPIAGWENLVATAGMSSRELEIEPEQLEAIPVGNRQAFILQKKVEWLRSNLHMK